MCNPNIIAVGHDSVKREPVVLPEQFIARTYDIVLVCTSRLNPFLSTSSLLLSSSSSPSASLSKTWKAMRLILATCYLQRCLLSRSTGSCGKTKSADSTHVKRIYRASDVVFRESGCEQKFLLVSCPSLHSLCIDWGYCVARVSAPFW